MRPDAPSLKLFVLLVIGGAGTGLIAYDIAATNNWLLLAIGVVAVVVSLVGVWRIQRPQIEAASRRVYPPPPR